MLKYLLRTNHIMKQLQLLYSSPSQSSVPKTTQKYRISKNVNKNPCFYPLIGVQITRNVPNQRSARLIQTENALFSFSPKYLVKHVGYNCPHIALCQANEQFTRKKTTVRVLAFFFRRFIFEKFAKTVVQVFKNGIQTLVCME